MYAIYFLYVIIQISQINNLQWAICVLEIAMYAQLQHILFKMSTGTN